MKFSVCQIWKYFHWTAGRHKSCHTAVQLQCDVRKSNEEQLMHLICLYPTWTYTNVCSSRSESNELAKGNNDTQPSCEFYVSTDRCFLQQKTYIFTTPTFIRHLSVSTNGFHPTEVTYNACWMNEREEKSKIPIEPLNEWMDGLQWWHSREQYFHEICN